MDKKCLDIPSCTKKRGTGEGLYTEIRKEGEQCTEIHKEGAMHKYVLFCSVGYLFS